MNSAPDPSRPLELAGIEAGDQVVFYPTFGYLDAAAGAWVIPIHGWVFQPGRSRRKQTVALALLRRYLGRRQAAGERELFKLRSVPFRVRSSRGRRISVRAGGALHELARSGSGGRFGGSIRLSAAGLAESEAGPGGVRWIDFQADLPSEDSRTFAGQAQLLPDEGLSVVSDIDDTIKITAVYHRREMLRNTFLREFAPVPGMAELYTCWAARGAAFHYVSASPWQLFDPLSAFLAAGGFPRGSFHLKLVRGKLTAFWKLFASPVKTKLPAIEALMSTFPRRRFVLVGDTAARDPELYAVIARRRPEQTAAIILREAPPGGCDPRRLQQAFAELPAALWQVFRDPAEVRLPEARLPGSS